jgi:hypothetical protein
MASRYAEDRIDQTLTRSAMLMALQSWEPRGPLAEGDDAGCAPAGLRLRIEHVIHPIDITRASQGAWQEKRRAADRYVVAGAEPAKNSPPYYWYHTQKTRSKRIRGVQFREHCGSIVCSPESGCIVSFRDPFSDVRAFSAGESVVT